MLPIVVNNRPPKPANILLSSGSGNWVVPLAANFYPMRITGKGPGAGGEGGNGGDGGYGCGTHCDDGDDGDSGIDGGDGGKFIKNYAAGAISVGTAIPYAIGAGGNGGNGGDGGDGADAQCGQAEDGEDGKDGSKGGNGSILIEFLDPA